MANELKAIAQALWAMTLGGSPAPSEATTLAATTVGGERDFVETEPQPNDPGTQSLDPTMPIKTRDNSSLSITCEIPRRTTPENKVEKEVSGFNYHRGYATSRGIILQSTDDVCFGFDIGILAKHSDFFKDLCDLPCPSPAEEGMDPVVPVPAEASSIKVVLDAASALENGHRVEPLASPTSIMLDGLLIFFDMLDCRKFIPPLVDTEVRFAFAAFSNDYDTINELSPKMLPFRNDHRLGKVWWVQTLTERCPYVHRQLGHMYSMWDEALDIFQARMPNMSQTLAFGGKCRGTDLYIPGPCDQYIVSKGDFKQFRTNLIKEMTDRIANGQILLTTSNPSVWRTQLFAEARRLDIKCRRCANRFGFDIVRVLVDSWPTWEVPSPIDTSKWRIGPKSTTS